MWRSELQMVEKGTAAPAVSVGEVVNGTVEHVAAYGAFVRIESGQKAMIHISELSHSYVKKVEDVLTVGQKVTAKVIKIDEKGPIDLSIKRLEDRPSRQHSGAGREDTFEKKITSFLKISEQKIADLNSKANASKSSKKRPAKPK